MDRITQRLRREGGDGAERLTVDEARRRDVCAATHAVYATAVANFPDIADPNEAKHGVYMDIPLDQSEYLDRLRAPVISVPFGEQVHLDTDVNMRQAA